MKDLRNAIENVVKNSYYDRHMGVVCVKLEAMKILVAEYNIHFVEIDKPQLEMPE